MPKVATSNAGFSAADLKRREFQNGAAATLDRQAKAIQQLQERVRVQGEFMADMSVRIDDLAKRVNG